MKKRNVVVDARGGNSHEAGGTRLAVLKLSQDADWPCTRRSLSHRSTFGKLARCRISETLARRVSPDGFPPLFLLSSLSFPVRRRDLSRTRCPHETPDRGIIDR
jgi:hypothetical protein